MNTSKKSLIFFLLLVVCIQISGSFFTLESIPNWYPTLIKPSWNPPIWVFGPTWTVLYLSIAISGWLVSISPSKMNKKLAFTWYSAQLLFNALWSYLFFYLKSPLLGLIDISFLVIAIYGTIHCFFSISRKASILLIPYLAWVLYATSLNVGIYILNR